MELPSPDRVFAMILFGAIGFAAFVYGKKSAAWKPMVLGIALMGYPYFISSPFLFYAVGVALTAALFFFRN